MARRKRALEIVPRNLAKLNLDIKTWVSAKDMYLNVLQPRNYKLQQLFERVVEDDMVLSQMGKLLRGILQRKFTIKNDDGTVNEEETKRLKDSKFYTRLIQYIFEKEFFIYSLVEFNFDDGENLEVKLIDRTNVVPQNGMYYRDYGIYDGINYRNLPDYGSFILEFNANRTKMGILNSCTPKFLIKDFTLKCYAEFVQIYGTPMRVLKTDTNDPEAMDRGEDMMKNMGVAAWAVIDKNEEFNFADNVTTTGDVYTKLTTTCDNAIVMAISSAVVGLDTKNGSNSKEQTSKEITDELVESYIEEIQADMNNKVMKALFDIGFFTKQYRFEFNQTEDITQLWTYVKDLLPHKKFDNDWLFQTFGIVCEDAPAQQQGALISSTGDFFV